MALRERLISAWNAFSGNKDPTTTDESDIVYKNIDYSGGYGMRPDRFRYSGGSDRSIVTAIYNRIAIDASSVDIRHVRLDSNNRFVEEMDTGLNECLSLDANTDQTGRAFILDAVQSLLDEGVVALVPVETTYDPRVTGSFDINTIRVGKIVKWFPQHVKISLYNERLGKHREIIMPKASVAIVQNPFYSVMNEQNSTMKRLIRKLAILDVIDEQKGAGKLDLIIQLPYVVKSEARKAQAEARRKDIELQLSSSKYGIAYTDGTEKVTQLNRSIDNQLQAQVEYLTRMLYSQLGIDETILNGTANEETMTNYYNRTIEPILCAIVEEMKRKFLTKTARTQKQSIMFFRDSFKLVPVTKLADIADRFTRNEIMSSNEIRQIIGMKPSDDPKADELRNKNIAQPEDLDGDGIPDEPIDDYESQYPEDENQYEQY